MPRAICMGVVNLWLSFGKGTEWSRSGLGMVTGKVVY